MRVIGRMAAPLLALMVAGCGLASTGLVAYQLRQSVRAEALGRFELLSERVSGEVVRRLQVIPYGLRGARAVFLAPDVPPRAAFQSYVASRDLAAEFPGAMGIGFVQRVPRGGLDVFVAQVRSGGVEGFEVRNPADSGEHYVLRYMEPEDVNRPAWGMDAAADPVRRSVLERAMLTGEPSMTPAMRLMQQPAGARGGWSMSFPSTAAEPHRTHPKSAAGCASDGRLARSTWARRWRE